MACLFLVFPSGLIINYMHKQPCCKHVMLGVLLEVCCMSIMHVCMYVCVYFVTYDLGGLTRSNLSCKVFEWSFS